MDENLKMEEGINLLKLPVDMLHKLGLMKTQKINMISTIILLATIIVNLFLLVSGICQFFYIENNIFAIVEVAEGNGMLVQIFGRLTILYLNHDKFQHLVASAQRFWKSTTCSETIHQEIQFTLKRINFILKLFLYSAVGCVSFLMGSIFIGRPLPMGSWQMEDQPLLYNLNLYLSLLTLPLCAGIVILGDAMFLGFCFELGAQFKILSYHLQGLNVENIESDIDLKNYEDKLVMYIEHHQFLMNFLKSMAEAYSALFLVEFSTVSALMCFEMYAIAESIGSLWCLRYIIFMIPESLQLGFYCLSSDYIVNKALVVANAIYFSNWYGKYVNKSLRTLIIMILRAAQTEFKFTAVGLVTMNSRNLLSVYRAGISVAAILRSLKT